MTEQRTIAHRLAAGFLGLPLPVLGRITGATGPVVVDGRTLDARLAALLALSARLGMERSNADVAVRRAELRRLATMGMFTRTGVHVTGRTADLGHVTVDVRVYRRHGLVDDAPGIVYFHGGGWVTGDLDTHDGTCRLLADESGCVVVAVDYRLAPEHPFPAAVDDGCGAYAWVWRNARDLGIRPERIGVMGDSAGATLAAVVAQQFTPGVRLEGPDRPATWDDPPPPAAQCLVYPCSDSRLQSPSMDSLGEGFFLSRADMEWFREQYVPDPDDWTDVRASPILAESLTGLPPAIVVTAGFDPLREDGLRYADAMRDAGVEVLSRCYDGFVHGFFGMGVHRDAAAAAVEICAAMGDRLH